MITKHTFGPHLETDAVVVPVEEGQLHPFFTAAEDSGQLTLTAALTPSDRIFGLGETVGGMNKRGKLYVSYNVDIPKHREDNLSLYASHNFIVIDGPEKLGFFVDTPGRVIFDLGETEANTLTIRCSVGMTLYTVTGESLYDITRQFLAVIGRSFVPPRWAFGFGQSRWGYKTEGDIRKVVDRYAAANLPLEYICMDIDYMDRYIDFTVNKRRFRDLPGLVAELKAKGIRLVPIVDAGIKIEPGNPVYESGLAGGYFCTKADGKPFEGAVWPGMTHFPDFLNPEARAWFGSQYRFYTEQGLEGFWNDMNEPAIFYTEARKDQPKDRIEGEDELYQKDGLLCNYKDFYHRPNGEPVRHHEVHNLYGYNMTRASAQGLDSLLDHRYLLFSRSSYIGAHRYGGIWTGDNESRWDHLAMNIRQMPGMNMCGFLFSGADTGGFGADSNRELLLRWLAFSAFTPLMRDHSSAGTRNQECYRFGDTEAFRRILELRYCLLPYIYSEFVKAALRQDMLMKPLRFVFPEDETAADIEDQLILGESVMVTPLIHKGRKTRKVYLPQDMTMMAYRGGSFTASPMAKGWHTIRAELDEVVFFILKDRLLPLAKAAKNTAAQDQLDLTLWGDGTEYELYTDDGLTRDLSLDHLIRLKKENC